MNTDSTFLYKSLNLAVFWEVDPVSRKTGNLNILNTFDRPDSGDRR